MSIHLDGTAVPFVTDPDKRLLRVGLQGAVVDDQDRPPANLTFIVDVSGSMQGHNLEMVQSGLHRLLESLRPDDAVAVTTFDTEARLVLPMTSMTRRQHIKEVVSQLRPGGSTNLQAGLRVGYEQASENLRADGINRVVLLSDGVANVGETDPGRLADQIGEASGDHTQLVVVGVGRGTYHDVILEQFANQGNGFYAYIDTIGEAERLFVHDLTGTLLVVARDAKVQVTFHPAAVSRFRLLGYENRQLDHDDFTNDTVDGGVVGAGHNVTALYEVTLVRPTSTGVLATVDLRWSAPDTGERVERSATITAAELTDTFTQAPPRLRQDVLVAAFAESLRDAPWGELVTPAELARDAQLLSQQMPGDDRLAEFAELVTALLA